MYIYILYYGETRGDGGDYNLQIYQNCMLQKFSRFYMRIREKSIIIQNFLHPV